MINNITPQQNSLIKSSTSSRKDEILTVLGNEIKIKQCIGSDIYSYFPDRYTSPGEYAIAYKKVKNKFSYFDIDLLSKALVNFIVVDSHNQIVGYTSVINDIFDYGRSESVAIEIDEMWRGKGLSKKLQYMRLQWLCDNGYNVFDTILSTTDGKEYAPRELHRLQSVFPQLNIRVRVFGEGSWKNIDDYCVEKGISI